MLFTIEITDSQYQALQKGYRLKGSLSLASKWATVIDFNQYSRASSPLDITRVRGGFSSITKSDLACNIGIKMDIADLTIENLDKELDYIKKTVREIIEKQ